MLYVVLGQLVVLACSVLAVLLNIFILILMVTILIKPGIFNIALYTNPRPPRWPSIKKFLGSIPTLKSGENVIMTMGHLPKRPVYQIRLR